MQNKNIDTDYRLVNEWFLIAYDKHSAKHISNMHYHNSYEMFIMTDGSTSMLVNDQITEPVRYDIILIKPNQLHKNNGGAKHSRYAVHFTENYLNTYFTEAASKQLTKIFDRSRLRIKPQEFNKIIELLGRMYNGDAFSHIHLAEIISILSRPESLDYNNAKPGGIVNSILEYVNNNYASISSLDDISEKFRISKPYMCNVFKKETTVTISQYLNSVRITRACELLKTSHKSVTEIALMCGYGSSMYFCKVFKGIVNMTPMDYRRFNL